MEISDLKTEIGQKTINMVLLGLATLGIYYIIWLIERYKVFNKLAGKEVISRNFIIWIAAMMGISSIFSYAGDPSVEAIGSLLDLVWMIMCIIVSFKYSKIMDEYYAKEFKLDLKFNKFYLIIFNIFYINYCVNELEEIEVKQKTLSSDK
ncbi:MAG: DUF4234 domain-containing protein [Deltaproteobacteria bacterium]|nr:DUF4234 domain-containing protein [Candidatus Tharpella aukensis]